MGTEQGRGSVVVLSEGEESRGLALQLATEPDRVACYGTLEELVRGQPLGLVEVLVVHGRPMPRGVLLAALGRLQVEYPGMQKVAVLDAVPPLPIAQFLTACGVELVWGGTGEERLRKLASMVDRMRERHVWVAGSTTPAYAGP